MTFRTRHSVFDNKLGRRRSGEYAETYSHDGDSCGIHSSGEACWTFEDTLMHFISWYCRRLGPAVSQADSQTKSLAGR